MKTPKNGAGSFNLKQLSGSKNVQKWKKSSNYGQLYERRKKNYETTPVSRSIDFQEIASD